MYSLQTPSTSAILQHAFKVGQPPAPLDARIFAVLSANSAAENTNSTRSVLDRATGPVAGTAKIIPSSILSNWNRLRSSGLPEGAFGELVSAASSPQRLPLGPKKPLSSEALESFLCVWQDVREASAEPVLSIDPTGAIVAEWFESSENALVIMSNSDGLIFYSLFSEGELPTEGYGPFAEVREVIGNFSERPVNPFSWSDAHGR